MFYERKVKYLDYLVRQERCGNRGFVKLEVRGDMCNLTLSVSNLRDAGAPLLKVYLVGGGREKELCTLELVQGKGTRQLPGQGIHDIGGTGISYWELEAIRIPISAEKEICGIFERTGGGEAPCMAEKVTAVEVEEAFREEPMPERMLSEEQVQNEEQSRGETQQIMEPRQQTEQCSIPLYDDKWRQLWEIYPHIAPFRDEREYLSVGPGDFVVLPGKYFRMANNSFLLHGYYNYKHLVLKKAEYRGEERYYIGVPGNFYDREKQVAVMFGFEGFEGLEEPARTGDYGYYLMRIEL